MASYKPGDNIAWKAPDGAVLEGTVVFAHDDGVLRVRKKGASEDVRIKASSITNSTPYSNGRQKAETYLNQRMKDAGVKVENIAIYVVEGEEFYGGTVFDAVAAWCKAHRKSEARVTAPGSVAGTYEMTAGGRAIKQ